MTDWMQVYRNVAHTWDRDNEMIPVSREALRLALSALKEQNGRDYYHNYGAAQYEIMQALGEKNEQGKS